MEMDNKLIGWLRYNLFWDNIPFMNMIYVIEDYQLKGYGKALVSFWENEMSKKGCQNVLASTLSNEEAQHFYRKLGYKDIGGFTFSNEPFEILFHKEI
jgi:ribosomal protein S18 acetylase RimI-like enzyme